MKLSRLISLPLLMLGCMPLMICFMFPPEIIKAVTMFRVFLVFGFLQLAWYWAKWMAGDNQ